MADCLNNEEQVTSNLDSKNQDSLNSNLDTGNAITSDIASDGVLVSNTNSGESVSSVLESGEALASQLDLPVTHTYRGAETDNIVVSVDNNAYTISASLKQIKFKTVADFPVVGSDRLLYIDATENSIYSWDSDLGEYRKLVADTSDVDVDLSDYYTKEETYSAKEIDDKISNVEVDLSGYYTKTETDNVATQTLGSAKSYTDTKVAELIDSAPETLDTFKEIADAFAENDEVLDALNSAIGFKADKSELSNYVTNTELENKKYATKSEVSGKVSLTGDEEIQGVKTFRSVPEIFRSQNDNAFEGNQIVPARFVEARLEEEKLVAGNNITIDGNVISADLGDGASITKLTSPVTISTLASGVYQLPANCELYMYSGASINYYNTSPATLTVQQMTEDNVEKRLFVLFAEAKNRTQNEVGTTGSFIVGKVGSASGNYHIVGTDKSYVTSSGDDIISGNKQFNNAIKYKSSLSLDTSLNDKTLVDAQWVNSVLAGKGYLTSIPSEYVTETELNAKGYLKSVPSEYVTETELTNKGYATQTSLNTTNSNVSANANAITQLQNTKLSNESVEFVSGFDFPNSGNAFTIPLYKIATEKNLLNTYNYTIKFVTCGAVPDNTIINVRVGNQNQELDYNGVFSKFGTEIHTWDSGTKSTMAYQGVDTYEFIYNYANAGEIVGEFNISIGDDGTNALVYLQGKYGRGVQGASYVATAIRFVKSYNLSSINTLYVASSNAFAGFKGRVSIYRSVR